MNDIEKYSEELFEKIKHIDEEGNEYWEARELQKALEYSKWENFHKVIKVAMISCTNSGNIVSDWFPEVRKSIINGKGRMSYIINYHLTRYACYLIAQNGDSRKKVIALAQTYFAIQTRKQEIFEDYYNDLPEDKKRIIKRNEIRHGNYDLNRTALKAGVRNFGKFHDAGYMGLYGGETANDIAKRKGLKYRQEILDHMGSDELIANQFRISQTNQKLNRDNVKSENVANKVHYDMGKDIREFISNHGGTMPEDLPTPKKSIRELEKDDVMKLGDS